MINLLLVDDSEDEQFLLEDELIQGGLSASIHRVDNKQGLLAALASVTEWDIALVDYFMPGFSAEEALQLLSNDEDIPAIVVSGHASEENAVTTMRLGARDYISKNNRFRLVPSIIREVESYNRRKKQLRFEKQLHQLEQKLAAVAEAAHDAIILMADGRKIEFWNGGAERLFGFTKEEILGKNVEDVLIPERYKKLYHRLFMKFSHTGTIGFKKNTFEAFGLQKNKQELPLEVSLSSLAMDNKWIAIAIVRDITERRNMQRKLKQLATHDSLTNLLNRRETIDKLTQEMLRFHRYHSPLTIFFIDIDFFKNINDKFGHNVGDDTLIDCTRKMRSLMRKNDIIGRYGGEEFLVILPETSLERAYELAERLRVNICNKENDTNKFIPNYTISIGIAQLTDENMDIDSFICEADKAMYMAKNTGRNKICVQNMEDNND